jgi:hypothetical protein
MFGFVITLADSQTDTVNLVIKTFKLLGANENQEN